MGHIVPSVHLTLILASTERPGESQVLPVLWAGIIQHNFHRHALDNFDPVAGRVFSAGNRLKREPVPF